ncbi:uncharacterized protein G2W53_027194 [Senna tora]|uniref:Uncharacterized protein n=1 Tax=Senna tora TaxID=362788 RepID=A0A834TIJ7_9FABA|nr:uncharacterized protein G2W53_027194 [Senna tora]
MTSTHSAVTYPQNSNSFKNPRVSVHKVCARLQRLDNEAPRCGVQGIFEYSSTVMPLPEAESVPNITT